ncbi:MAG: hypothetical protein ACRDBG_15000 [Waterburya sp.]
MNYILATIAEIKLEVQYRLWASQFNNLKDFENFGEFIRDTQQYSREVIDAIKFAANYDY